MRKQRMAQLMVVAVVASGLTGLGLSTAAQAYPAGSGLTLNIRSVEMTNRIELVARHAMPGAVVSAIFENGIKTRTANQLGIAVFSYVRPPFGVHVAVATSGTERATARQYSETFHLGVYAAYAGSTNTVTIRSSKPGTVMMLKVSQRWYSAVVGPDYMARVSFIVPSAGSYSIKVFCNGELEKVYTAISR